MQHLTLTYDLQPAASSPTGGSVPQGQVFDLRHKSILGRSDFELPTPKLNPLESVKETKHTGLANSFSALARTILIKQPSSAHLPTTHHGTKCSRTITAILCQ